MVERGGIVGSERVADGDGRQYHIDCTPGDLARFILIGGDPDRVALAERLFDNVRIRRRHREFTTITGEYRGTEVSMMSSGIGCDNIEIVVIEASQCVERPVFIRVGSCGALQPLCAVGDLVISESCVRREDTSLNYAPPDHVPKADVGVLGALKRAASELSCGFHVGVTCSTSSFYGGQGRLIEGFPTRHPGVLDELRGKGVLNFEMEMSTLFTLAEISTLGLRAGGVCAVFANRTTGEFISRENMEIAQERCLRVGLRAVEILAEEDGK
ncbi:MAG TPA: nucleoside phosphorylase [Acidobacteriota bacterium]|nr:nucleoside phosphorylase [Acidobacteriota bacterium]